MIDRNDQILSGRKYLTSSSTYATKNIMLVLIKHNNIVLQIFIKLIK